MLLVGELVAAENEAQARTLRLPASKASTRAELSRRLRLAADHIETCCDRPPPLETLAGVACMSSYHFLRYFSLLHGETPHAYVVRCRTAAARRRPTASPMRRSSRSGAGSAADRACSGAARAKTAQ